MVLDFSAPTETDTAIVLASDGNFLPFGLHLIRQILVQHPKRDFDIVYVSETPLEIPDWALAGGVRAFVSGKLEMLDRLPGGHVPRVSYMRVHLPRLLRGQYRRILYLDCDIFLEGGELDRLLRLDIGPYAMAAVRDLPYFLSANFHAREFISLGLGPLPYFNAGVLLIDLPAWERADLTERCLRFPVEHPEAVTMLDQSILNGVLQGKMAELSPVWNWLLNTRLPPATRHLPVRLRHFASKPKPWNDPRGRHDARFRLSYSEFFRLCGISPPGAMHGPTASTQLLPTWKELLFEAGDMALIGKRIETILSRFRDEWDVKT
jgi:lipopolysaccharide biosynthesis glycosyltransferase